jgi:hypothetical protein
VLRRPMSQPKDDILKPTRVSPPITEAHS